MKPPLLIYDGECGFCKRCVAWLEKRSKNRVQYRPSQEVAKDFPQISEEKFKNSVQFISETGEITEGSRAIFQVLALLDSPFLLWLYKHFPYFSSVTNHCYRLVAKNRRIVSRFSRYCFTEDTLNYRRTAETFSRGLGIVYFFAFTSLLPQIRGLYGSKGILPIERMISHLPSSIPTFFHWGVSDSILLGVCALGGFLGFLLTFQWFPRIVSFFLWALFLSLVNVSPIFLEYQWEALLLEVGFLAIFLDPRAPSRGILFLYRLLLFRLLFMSGVSKLMSGDTTWRDFTATSYHFESQPLPTALGWLWHQAPLVLHQVSCGLMFFLELCMPLLIWGNIRLRRIAFFLTLSLQLGFILTGNYGYFNYLSVVLSFVLLEDTFFERYFHFPPKAEVPEKISIFWKPLVITLLFCLSFSQMWVFGKLPFFDSLSHWTRNFHLSSPYGLFSVMTQGRRELFIEGSEDHKTWKEYKTRWKPDDPKKTPSFIAPHQPRLDWQLWFSALGDFQGETWMRHLLLRLFEGSHPVGLLFKENPFPNTPPKYLRVMSRTYRFSTFGELKEEGVWWKIGPPTVYSGELELDKEEP